VPAKHQIVSIRRSDSEQHLDLNIRECRGDGLPDHRIVRPDREVHSPGVELVGESQGGHVGLLSPAVGDLGGLEMSSLHEQHWNSGLD